MNTIRKLKLRNWMCFRGEHEIVLDRKSYAVTARDVRDAERSNWNGKSATFEAIDFVVRGVLNPDRQMGADGWITDGEKDGYVGIEMDNDDVITRSRKLGSSTQLAFNKAKGDEAQALIYSMMGMSQEDFPTICYFPQRKMARFILCRPEERMDFARAWFKLAPLEEGEDRIRERDSVLVNKIEALVRERQRLEDIEANCISATYDTLEKLQEGLEKSSKTLERSEDKRNRLQDLLGRNANLVLAQRTITEYEAIFDRHANLVDERPSIDRLRRDSEQASAVAAKIRESMQTARQDAESKEQVARGLFDGRCPVAEIACPVQAEINKNNARNKENLSAAQLVFSTKRAAYEEAAREVETKLAAYQSAQRVQDQIEDLAARLTRTRDEYNIAKTRPEPADVEDLRNRLFNVQNDVAEQTSLVQMLRERIERVHASRTAREALAVELHGLQVRLDTCREASVIFGKNGAQRRVAEGALAVIQVGANDMLQKSGIDLSLELSWAREGAGPAKTCDSCGSPFPKSAKIKTCRCGAERGPLIKNELHVLLSEQSGGSEDLCGLAVQLSASAWLRQKRGSQWSAAMLDEPFGQLDTAHRRLLSNHLATLLASRYGFAQAFVIAHHSAVLDALPGRIEIIRDGRYSSIRVAA